ncbi:histidine kinase [Parafrankia colletiae]|uniref:Histidine kinase n=1 Tax=Parafrankia colletiae TaxID=573497 RepID=A0A1S1QNJ9_9ACTN|nr:response regulator [Parafrankia colletiae]MCK9900578.1 response regulator [Frankia sp. Cpl3]OHV34692.1 histidine kinase [Parafrankia colletiae]
MRVALADDSPHLRAGLRALVSSLGAEVVAALGRGNDLVDVVTAAPAAAPVDVALVDMRMPPTHTDEGLRTARQIRALRPATAVLVFTADDEAPYAAELLRGAPGGTGYVLKSTITDRERLQSALDRLVAGDIVVDAEVARQVVTLPGAAPVLTRLDDRQQAALLLALQGRDVNGTVLAGLRTALGLAGDTGTDTDTDTDLRADAVLGRRGADGFIARELISWLLAHG